MGVTKCCDSKQNYSSSLEVVHNDKIHTITDERHASDLGGRDWTELQMDHY